MSNKQKVGKWMVPILSQLQVDFAFVFGEAHGFVAILAICNSSALLCCALKHLMMILSNQSAKSSLEVQLTLLISELHWSMILKQCIVQVNLFHHNTNTKNATTLINKATDTESAFATSVHNPVMPSCCDMIWRATY
jgi:hypothetical protein